MASGWGPLVGRDRELAACLGAVGAGASGSGAVVVGRAGAGKTRLLAEVADRFEGTTEVIVATASSASVPFGCFSHLLPLPDLDRADGHDLFTTLRRLRQAVAGRGAEGAVLLAVDDVHHLDAASATLVAQLAVTGEARLLLAVDPDAAQPAEVADLWRTGRCRRVELGPLDEAAVGAYLEGVLGGLVGPVSVAELRRVSDGNPLFLRELVDDALDGGRLVERGGVWRWEGVAANGRLAELLERHLERVAPDERALLDVLAVADPLPLPVVVELAGSAPLERLEASGLVELVGRPPRVRICQRGVAAVLAARLGPLRTSAIEAQLAPRLTAPGIENPDDVVRGVRWSLRSGSAVDPVAARRAALFAREGGDLAAADELLRAAIERGAGPAAHLELAEVLELAARPDEAWAVLAALDDLPTPAHQARRRACAIRVAANGLHDLDRARAVAEGGGPLDDTRWQVFVRAQWLTTRAMAGETEAIGDEAVALASGDDPVVGLRALSAANLALVAEGRLDDAVALAQALVPAALAHRDEVPAATSWLASALLLDLLLAGRHDDADAVLALVLADPSMALPGNRAFVLVAEARAALQRGSAAQAAAASAEAEALWADGYDDQGFAPVALGLQCAAAAVLGDVRQADGARARAEALLARSEPRQLHLEVRRMVAWAPVAEGDAASAVRSLVEVADDAAAKGQRTYEVLALYDAVRLGAPRDVQARLAAAAPLVQGPLPVAAGSFARALLADSGTQLEAVAAHLTDIGARLHAAEALVAASTRHRAQGLLPAARRTAAAVARLAAALAPATTPALADPLVVPALSARELQVARLAVAGLTNRAIAEVVGSAKRTVDNQLATVYRKLGVSGRPALAEVLGPQDVDGALVVVGSTPGGSRGMGRTT